MGRPTMLDRPTMTQCLPEGSFPDRTSISTTPAGVQGARTSVSPVESFPTFIGWKPSTSLAGSMARRILASSMCLGRGSWTRMPWISGSAFKPSTSPRSSASGMSAPRVICRE